MISVIVPAYNVAEYLRECVDSILAQTFKDIEVILVDDGSTEDATPQICDEYAVRDERVKVIHKANGGISSARNVGMKNSNGEFLLFVDADDFLPNNAVIEKLYDKIIQDNSDVVKGRVMRTDGVIGQIDKDNINLTSDKAIESYVFLRDIINFSYTAWSVLYRKSAIHCFFDESLRFFEDGEFIFHLYTKPLKCSYVPDIVYAYRLHSGSLTTSVSPYTIDSFRKVADKVNEYSKECYSEEMSKYYRQCRVMLYYWALDKLCDRRYYKDRMKYIRQYDLESFRRETFRIMLSLGRINKSLIYAVLPLRLATWIHP